MNAKFSLVLPYYNRKQYLLTTIDSLEHFYGDRVDLEIIIVDDGSDQEHRVDELERNSKLAISVIRIENKTGINPCYPYNVGARAANGEIILLSSPEIIHTSSIFAQADEFKSFKNDSYFVFSVYCPTDEEFNAQLLRKDIPFKCKLDIFDNNKSNVFDEPGKFGRSAFSNKFGSWYLHSKYRPSSLNFLTAISKNMYYHIGGFREDYRQGTGYDDSDLLDRLLPHTEVPLYFDETVALHLNHKPVSQGSPITNKPLYDRLKSIPYDSNDVWGRL